MRNLYKNFFATFAVVFISIAATPSFAAHEGHEHIAPSAASQAIMGNEIKVELNEAVIIVHGMVCSFCSQGVTRKLAKLPFIDASKYTKGVKVEIKDQKVTIAIMQGKQVDFQEVFASIKSGGYEPVKAYTADGQVILPNDNTKEGQ